MLQDNAYHRSPPSIVQNNFFPLETLQNLDQEQKNSQEEQKISQEKKMGLEASGLKLSHAIVPSRGRWA